MGEVTEAQTRPNGLRVERIRAPLGSILMIYEARPNVTADAAALCLRAGNAALLRGGKEAQRSNTLLVEPAQAALAEAGRPESAVELVEPERALLDALLLLEDRIDLCIPRGGPSLIRKIAEQSRIPVVKHYQGVCHLYVAPDADLEVACLLAVNGKAQRPSVCDALECLLVDSSTLADASAICRALWFAGVELRCDARALPIVQAALAQPVSPDEEARLAALLSRAGVPGGRVRRPRWRGRERLWRRVPRAEAAGRGGRRPGRRARAHCQVRQPAHRGDLHPRRKAGRRVHRPRRRQLRAGQRLDALQRRRRIGPRRGDRISTSKLHAYGPWARASSPAPALWYEATDKRAARRFALLQGQTMRPKINQL